MLTIGDPRSVRDKPVFRHSREGSLLENHVIRRLPRIYSKMAPLELPSMFS
jgi:hypothetical protein